MPRILTLLLVAITSASAASAQEVHVMSSGGLAAPYVELVPAIEKSTRQQLVTVTTSTGIGQESIPNRLRRGERADVVILPDASLRELIKEGLIVADSRAPIASSGIGMAVRAGRSKPDITSVDALRRALLAAKSVAFSAQVSGLYLSNELFPRLGIAGEMKSKSVLVERERVGAVVARGEAEIGFQQISELLPIAGIDYVGPLPAEAQRITVFSAAVATASKNPAGARAVIAALTSAEALKTLAKYQLEPAGAARFDDVRFVVGRHGPRLFRGEGLDDVRAVLVIDTQGRELRVEADNRTLLALPFGRITGLHYEESKYPKRFLSRSTPFLAIQHDAAADGVSLLRLSTESTPRILEAIERATGIRVDRGATTTSFAGLAIHLARDHVVELTDTNGSRSRGTVVTLSASSIDLGPAGRFDAASVRTIRVVDTLWDGVGSGISYMLLPAGVVSMNQCVESCTSFGLLTPAGWTVLAAGGVLGAVIDRSRMRVAFRRPEPSAPDAVEWRLEIGGGANSVRLAFRF